MVNEHAVLVVNLEYISSLLSLHPTAMVVMMAGVTAEGVLLGELCSATRWICLLSKGTGVRMNTNFG